MPTTAPTNSAQSSRQPQQPRPIQTSGLLPFFIGAGPAGICGTGAAAGPDGPAAPLKRSFAAAALGGPAGGRGGGGAAFGIGGGEAGLGAGGAGSGCAITVAELSTSAIGVAT